MGNRKTIHTSLSPEAYSILEYYAKPAKNRRDQRGYGYILDEALKYYHYKRCFLDDESLHILDEIQKIYATTHPSITRSMIIKMALVTYLALFLSSNLNLNWKEE